MTQPVARPAVPRPAPLPTSTEDEIVVALWRGYVKSRFYATAARPDGTETTLAASPYFRLARKRPIAESKSARNAYDALSRDLAELGWRPVETGEVFASRFRR